MSALGVAAARPTQADEVPTSATSIVLALDVSSSMCATDVEPNRLVAAQDAASAFIREQDGRLGIVAFAGFASLVVAPTTDEATRLEAVDDLTTSRGTAIGMAILESLDAIAEINPEVEPTGTDLSSTNARGGDSYVPDVIVLLTDGTNSAGVDPLTAAEQAAERGVRIYSIGFGTDQSAQSVCTVDQIGEATGSRPSPRAVIDEATLTEVADLTGGEFYRAEDAGQLADVLLDLPNEIVMQERERELTVWFVFIAAALATAALTLSTVWNRSL